MAMPGLCYCTWAFSSCGEWKATLGCSVRASRCSGFSCGTQALGHVNFSSCDTWAQLPLAMWDLPGPGIEPVSSALQDRFLTTGPSGNLTIYFLTAVFLHHHQRVFLHS